MSSSQQQPEDEQLGNSSSFHDLSDKEKRIYSMIPRLGAGISLACALYLVYTIAKSPQKRSRIFHRIMMGCALNIVLLNVGQIVAPYAVPSDFQNDGFPLARGTQATCSASGFLQSLGFAVPCYYVALSLLCYFAIRNKFVVAKYIWIEKYIHIGVYLWPIASGAYILMVEGYNPALTICTFVSLPPGCGDESGEACIRGPSNYTMLVRWLVGLPIGFILLFPTLIMAVLYLRIRLWSGRKGAMVAASMGRQAGMYLVALYWTYLFGFVFASASLKIDRYIPGLHMMALTTSYMQGAWISIAYWYLKSDDTSSARRSATSLQKHHHQQQRSKQRTKRPGVISSSAACMTSMTGQVQSLASEKTTTIDDATDRSEGIPSTHEIMKETTTLSGLDTTVRTEAGESSTFGLGRNHKMVGNNKTAASFSIFDGTGMPDPTSPWAAFLLDDDGEDESYQLDCGEHDDTAFAMRQP